MSIPQNILKAPVTVLENAPYPKPDTILHIQAGKVAALGSSGEQSAIAKVPSDGPIFASKTGFVGDEHLYNTHGGIERAVNQYCSAHYAHWRSERPNQAKHFAVGGFGENIVTERGIMNEKNVCVGDIYCIFRPGEAKEGVLLEVSEPRNPCYKLNIRFDHPTTLKSIQRTGRVGWNYRVLKEGYVQKGDVITLVKRPNPKWSCENVLRVCHGRSVEPSLIEEVAEMGVITQYYRDLAVKRMNSISRKYRVVEMKMITSRVKEIVFELVGEANIKNVKFDDYAHARINFGPEFGISRSYSIVNGDLRRFVLAVSLDEKSTGGSKYIHEKMKVGEEIKMAPGSDDTHTKNEEICRTDENIENRIVIAGGIGITAFIPIIKSWEQTGLPFEVHYAVRSIEDAAYKDILPADRTTFYTSTKENPNRLDPSVITPPPNAEGVFKNRIFCSGPAPLLFAVKLSAKEYPKHLLHFESFGPDTSTNGPAFEVGVTDANTGRKATLNVPSDRRMLDVLKEAGFDVLSSCQAGGCGSCEVAVACGGEKIQHTTDLGKKKGERAMLSCVDRATGKIEIEVD